MTWITTEGGLPIITEDTGDILVTEGTPPGPNAPLQSIIEAYPYQEYADDPNVVAFFAAYNILAQTYLDWFNQTSLAVYTLPSITGPLLDWVLTGIYGIKRPVFASFVSKYIAGLNAYPINTVAVNGRISLSSGSATLATDDYYKRVATWALYLGNTRYFNVQLLRYRVARFIYGINGGDVTLAQAQTIHIQPGYLPPPPAPTLGSVAGGSLSARTYGVRESYLTPIGETLAGYPATEAVASNHLLVADSPPAYNGADTYNVYAATISSAGKFIAGLNALPVNGFAINGNNRTPVSWQLQNNTPIAIGTNWTEPASGLVELGPPPNVNTSNTPTNYIITVPTGQAADYFKLGIEQGVLAFPFQLQATVVIE